MKKLLILLGILMVCLFSCSSKSGKHLVKAAKSAESVVLIKVYNMNDSTCEMECSGIGSGIVINNEGYIISCNHVTDSSDSLMVICDDDTMSARLVGGSKYTDMSLLKVKKHLKPIKIGRSSSLSIGEEILSIGYPSGLGRTVTSGIVSNLIKDGTKYDISPLSYIQTDAVINPGSSGGAIVNSKGELVGLSEMLITPTGFYVGYSFAIQIDILKKQINYAINMDKILNKDK